MIYRHIVSHLQEWTKNPGRKPLIIRGARQVGKTSVVNLFSQQFDQYLSLNLELSSHRRLFEQDLPLKDLFQAILLHLKQEKSSGQILLFIDEVQNSPQAINLLRYFYEELPELYVIAAGSLLDVLIKEEPKSFPVGRVEFMYLYPLSFQEYLTATQNNQALSTIQTIPFPEYGYQTLFAYFHRYTLIGGMPEVVASYLENENLSQLGKIYDSLMTTYQEDVEKYVPFSLKKILRYCIETAPLEAGKRIKFEGFANSSYKSKEIGDSLRLLERAMLLYLLYPTTSVGWPAIPNLKKSPRLQFLDTGLINHVVGLTEKFFSLNDLGSIYQGILAEHIVGQELLAMTIKKTKPLFWVREKKQSNAEIDFVFPHEGKLFPIEVKSGKAGSLRSLHQFIETTDYPYAIRLYAGKVSLETHVTITKKKKFYLLNLPYFLVSKIPDYINWMIHETPV